MWSVYLCEPVERTQQGINKMTEGITIALISSIIGGLLVAIVNQLFTRKRTEAEAEKLRAEAESIKTEASAQTEKIKAEAEKIKAEAEKIRHEISRASAEAAKLGDTVEKAASLISGSYLSESETSRKLIQEVMQGIFTYLRESESERGERRELIGAISSLLKNDIAMSEFMIDSLITKGYLIETSPGRYEISRTAKQKFISGGIK